ncbi:MAG TPA: VCBS domain-containing protein [Noviherbaspirillum sp.]|nr:VCBS domain-containing protein [Noviherbaspirillum sp.]
MAATSNGIKTSFSNTPQAKDDAFINAALTEDAKGVFVFDVMANDAGGNAKSLYAIDFGGDANRLLTKDAARSEATTTDTSALGAKIWITADGKIGYCLTDAVSQQLQSLGAGEALIDRFTYAIQLGNGTLSWATATVRVEGSNDAPVVTAADLNGAVTEALVPAGKLVGTGVIAFADADLKDAHLLSVAPAGANLGTLTASLDQDTTGTGTGGKLTWSYNVDAAAVEFLAQGETRTESFTVTLDDQHGGVVTKQVDVIITGTNDIPVIGGSATASVNEDTAAMLSAGGTLTIADADLNQSAFVAKNGETAYGNFSIDAAGTWTYSADNTQTAIQQLGAGQSLTDSFIVGSLDGSASQTITVTINGVNDVAVIGGTSAGSVTEDGVATIGGALTIADADLGQAAFAAQANVAGDFGSFGIDAAGNWNYSADNTQTAIQQLGAGQSLTDSFIVGSLDGSASQAITVTINGVNDVAVIGGTSASSVTEDGVATIGGALTIADADLGQAAFAAQNNVAGDFGSFGIDAAGNWTYSANNNLAQIQQLGAGQSVTDSFTVASLDGSASEIVKVTINGANDAALIGLPSAASVTEDANVANGKLVATGTVSIADADLNQAQFQTVVTPAAGTLGTLTLAANGSYSYSVDNSAVQGLKKDETKVDTFTIKSVDGTAKDISFTINGANEAARVQPRILFVDDDGGVTSNVTWTNTLQSLGYTFDVQTLAVNGNPSNLQNYDLVIWSVSDRAYSNLTSQNVSTLTSYLNAGGDLIYAGGHNLYEEPAAASFIQNYLGLSNYQYNMPSVNAQAHLHASGPGGSYTLSDFSDNPGFTSVYGGTMMSAFRASQPTTRLLMEITSGGAHAGHSGSANFDITNNDIAAINDKGTYRAATLGFDLNQLDPQYRSAFLDQVVQLVGGSSWDTVFGL